MKLTKTIPTALLGALVLSSVQTASAVVIATLGTTFSTTVAADGTTGAATVNSGLTPVGSFNIRERRIAGQVDRRIASFLGFDLSSITVAQANDANFEAVFSADYISQLNALNSASATVGGVTGTTFTFADAAGATDTATLIANIATTPPGGSVSVDVTDAVVNFINGTDTDFALAVFIPILEAQGAGFENPQLVASVVPEPSALALLALGFLPLARRRR